MKSGCLVPVLDRGRVDNVLYWAGVGFAPRTLDPEELENCIADAGARELEIVFPSHWFEYAHRALALDLASRRGIPVAVQVSPGAELEEFFPVLSDPAFSPSVELIMDRPLHAADLSRIQRLSTVGRELRYIVCPTREFDGAKTYHSLPESAKARARFYFPPKRDAQDRFLDADEIFLLSRRLVEARGSLPIAEYLHPHELCAEDATVRAYRKFPDESYYRKHFVQLGNAKGGRRIMANLAGPRRWGGLGLVVPWFLFFLVGPAEAAGSVLAVARARLHALWVRVYWAMRSFATLFVIQAYWRLRSPAWTVKTYLPPFYWIFIFPFQKVWWFGSYQFSRRILKR